MSAQKLYVTSPIYYVNDNPHIGHAYTNLACDVWARFMRLDGHDVFFLTGTDEHGQKVEKSAELAGVSPKIFVDEKSQKFRDLFKALDFSNDDFMRTTEPRHQKAVHHIWNLLLERDQIYLSTYSGWYAIRDEAYYNESELIDGKAPTGAPVEWVEEPCYFFRLSAWQDRLLEFYQNNPDFMYPKSRGNEVLSFVRGGLKDLAVSRTTFKWGIPVPNDPAHVMYVWFDALTNYLTALDYPNENWQQNFWAHSYHVMGKDILRFHAVYWPAFLMAADLMPPKQVVAHGWWTNEGEKISKSLGNVINPIDLIEKYGLDQTRYFLMREVSFGNDGNFSHQAMIKRMNSELANDLGNLVQRVLVQVSKNCAQKVPEKGTLLPQDLTLLEKAYNTLDQVRDEFWHWGFNKALDQIWEVIGDANRYIDEQAPWGLKKTDLKRMETVLYTLCETIRVVGLFVQPFMHKTANQILDLVGVKSDHRDFSYLLIPLESGVDLPQPSVLFPRFVEAAA